MWRAADPGVCWRSRAGRPWPPTPPRCAAQMGQLQAELGPDPARPGAGPDAAHRRARGPAVAAGGAAAPAHRPDRGGRVRPAADLRPDRRARGRSRRAAAGRRRSRDRGPPRRAAAGGAGRTRAAAAPGASPRSSRPTQSARQGYVLGTIPQDALQGQPAARRLRRSRRCQARLAPQGADAAYKQALDLLQAGNWADAEQAFTTFVQSYPDDPARLDRLLLARRDLLCSARTTRPRPRCSRATTGPTARTAPRAPDNLLKLGMALAAMGDRDKACQTFAELGQAAPERPGADPPGPQP